MMPSAVKLALIGFAAIGESQTQNWVSTHWFAPELAEPVMSNRVPPLIPTSISLAPCVTFANFGMSVVLNLALVNEVLGSRRSCRISHSRKVENRIECRNGAKMEWTD